MKWCVDFPEESILVVRPCLKRMCLDNKPAAKLLSVLLYRYSIRKEAKEDAENINEVKTANGETPDQDTSFRIYRKQSQIVTDMVDEIDEKTLHDVAVPTLQLLGYLDIEEHPGMHCYIVHYDRVVAGISAYKKGAKALESFLKEIPQLEKVLISVQLEKVRINKRNFQLEIEKILIGNRENSNCKRGRKVKSKADSDGVSEEDRLLEIITEIGKEESVSTAPPPAQSPASDTHTSFINSSSSQEQVAETTAPTPQARSADSATSTSNAPRTPTSPSVSPTGVRGVFPQDTNVVGIPPADNKAQVNTPKKARWELLLDYWDSKYGPSPRPKWVEKEAQDMIKRMEPTPEKIDKVCAELKARHKPVTFETMYNNWHLLKEVEEREQAKTNATPKSISGRRRVETDPAYAEYLAAMMAEGGK
jgi:hypothetical protein